MIKKTKTIAVSILLAGITFTFSNCSSNEGTEATTTEEAKPTEAAVSADPMQNKGIGPITSLNLGALDNTLAETGKTLFEAKCTACHKFDKRVVGPPLQDITKRRTPEWIMNMILNPSEMLMKDPIAKDLLATYIAQMANQSLTQDEARAVLEYFRSVDNKQ